MSSATNFSPVSAPESGSRSAGTFFPAFTPRYLRRPPVFTVALSLTALLLAAPVGYAQTKEPATATGVPAVSDEAARKQAELVQQLLNRIEQLEKKDAERAATTEKQHAAEVEKFQQRIQELEGKVGALESGKVLPEIKVTAESGPTTQELDQKIRILERNNELAAEAAAAKAKDQPQFNIGQNGLSFTSADTNFTVKIKGLVQADSRTFFNDHPQLKGNDGFVLRRARPIIEGTFFHDFDFQLVPDFGGSAVQVVDANLTWRLWPELQLKLGKFKGPVGLEMLQSDATLPFNERGFPTALVPTRSVGVQVGGDILDGTFSYALALLNGSGDARTAGNVDFSDDKEYAGRAFVQPFKLTEWEPLRGFGFGVGASYSQVVSNAAALPSTSGGTLAGYATDGQQQFFAYNPTIGPVVADGNHWRLAPQGYYYYGPFGILGEYTLTRQGVLNASTARKEYLRHNAWQISAQWVLTGEAASFNGLTPKRPFSLHNGGWGAWQLVGRYGKLRLDDDTFPAFADPALSAESATEWSVGINWWLNKNVRFLTSYSHTFFEGGGGVKPSVPGTLVPPATVTFQDEDVLFTRFQISF